MNEHFERIRLILSDFPTVYFSFEYHFIEMRERDGEKERGRGIFETWYAIANSLMEFIQVLFCLRKIKIVPIFGILPASFRVLFLLLLDK